MAAGGDIWAEGWVEEPRAVLRSDLYRSLTHPQREVLHALYRLANYRPGRLASGVVVEVGQVACSLRRIADEANTSIKVVRTTLRLLAGGSERDGIGPLAVVPEGTTEGTRTRVVTLLQYPRSRSTDAGRGTNAGTGAGTPGARSGHARGTDRRKGRPERRKYFSSASEPKVNGDAAAEALFAFLVRDCPRWDEVRRRLTTERARQLEGEALALCAKLAKQPQPRPPEWRQAAERSVLALLARYEGQEDAA